MLRKKKFLSLLVLMLILLNGCSMVGLTLPSSVKEELSNSSWEPVNNNEIKANHG